MAEYKFGDGLKTIFLAGVGAIATTAEKSSEIISDLVKKGELTVEQGKELNKDMQQNLKSKMAEAGFDIDEMTQKVTKMSADELAKLKDAIEAAEKSLTERLKKAEEDAEDAAAEAEDVVEDTAEAACDAACDATDSAEDAACEAAEAAEEKVEEIIEE